MKLRNMKKKSLKKLIMNFKKTNAQILKFECTPYGSPNAGLGI